VFPSIIAVLALFGYAAKPVTTIEKYQNVFRVTKESVHIRSKPSKDGAILVNAKRNSTFRVVGGDSMDWTRVLVPDQSGQEGYIRSDLGEVEKELLSSTKIRRLDSQRTFTLTLIAFCGCCLLAWCWLLTRIDRKRKTLEIFYEMDEQFAKLHTEFMNCFRGFAQSEKVWQTLQAQSTSDHKYSGGASQLIKRVLVERISVDTKPSRYLQTNVAIPQIVLRDLTLYFFPERLVLKRGTRFAALQYKNIQIEASLVRFIETDPVPSDARIVDYTWKYVNKSGEPDRRFSGNRQIPICQYSEYQLRAAAGLNEIITTSKVDAMSLLADFLNVLGKYQRELN
jgi:uncharacterized protein YgiM (DUF1202 family)